MNQGASSSSSSADQRFAGTGGSEDFQLFENKTLALLEARWGEAAADVWHGKYKDGKEFFTADKINDCKDYIKTLESGKTAPSPPAGTEAETLAGRRRQGVFREHQCIAHKAAQPARRGEC